MGQSQSQSQSQEETSYNSKNTDAFEQDQFQNSHSHENHGITSDDLLFSSQIQSSINPIIPLPQRSTKIKFSSSPTSRLNSSQDSTPNLSRKMSGLSSYQYPPALSSSMDHGVRAEEHETPSQPSKKKKRSKKRRSSASHPDEDHRPSVPHSPIDDNTAGYDPDVHTDANADSMPVNGQTRSQNKKDKKESRRAAKLARQQAEASAILETDQEPSQFAAIWDSQERAIAAKRERQEEEDPPTRTEEHVESHTATSRKRKRKSQTQAEDALQRGSKKRKSSLDGTTTKHDEQAIEDATGEHDLSNNSDINFNELAEIIYSGRKRKPHSGAIEEEPESVVEAVGNQKDTEAMDVDEEIEDDLSGNEPADDGASEEVVEEYRDDDIDQDYKDDNNDAESIEVPPTSHIITTRRSSTSMNGLNGLTNGARNGWLPDGGIMPGDVVAHKEQNGTGTAREIALNNINGTAYQDVEVPSSVPHPSSAGESSTKRRRSVKTSTGRKRVAKPDFFSRLGDEVDDNANSQSPSTAALSRRNGKGKQSAISEDETQAGPSTANGKAKQPKIISMLERSSNEDGDIPMTPTNESVVRLRTPRSQTTLSGAFSDFEIQNLTQAIERFRDDRNMTQYAVNELIHRNPKEAKGSELWEHILATCPGRSRQKVINQTRRRFHNFVARGTWTVEQEQELRQLFEHHGGKYAMIGQHINRHPEDVRDRIRNYIMCGDNQRRDQWSKEETDRLIAIVEQAIAEIRQQRTIRGLDDSRPVEDDINWQLVSQGMDRTRSRLQCISKWKSIKPLLNGGGLDGEIVPIDQIIQQARETATTMSYRNRSLIINEILKTNANADSRIPWLKVRNELGARWTRPPIMIVWFRLKRTLPNWQSLNVKETCTLLLQGFQQTHKLEYPDEESGELNYDAEYREIEYKINRGRKSHSVPKSAAFITKASEDEDEDEDEGEEEGGYEEQEANEATHDQVDVTGEEAVEDISHGRRPRSVDLGVGNIDVIEREVEDSEPEIKTRSRRRTRRTLSGRDRIGLQHIQQEGDDDQSSDTNASQVSSIPARRSGGR